MKKISILLTLAGAFVFGQSLDVQATAPFSPSTSVDGTNDIILNQPNDLTNGIVSDYFVDFGAGVYCADDFDMPFDGKLTSVTAYGFNNGGNFLLDTSSIRFFIIADDGGMWVPEGTDPETEHLYRFDVDINDPALDVDTSTGGVYITLDFEVLGENVFLENGEKYWLSVVPVMDNTEGDGSLRWNWFVSSTNEGMGEGVLIDPDDLFDGGYQNWTPIFELGLPTGNLAMTVQGEEAMGLNDLGQEANFVVYPNPTVNFIKVKTSADVKEMTVYSIDGKQVASSTTDTVRVTSLPAGIYVVKVMDVNGKVHTQKVVKK